MAAMAKRALRWALGATLFVFLFPIAMGLLARDGSALVPPPGELVVMGIYVVVVFVLTFAVVYGVEWSRRRKAGGAQMRANR